MFHRPPLHPLMCLLILHSQGLGSTARGTLPEFRAANNAPTSSFVFAFVSSRVRPDVDRILICSEAISEISRQVVGTGEFP
jgi:hypothetical protein